MKIGLFGKTPFVFDSVTSFQCCLKSCGMGSDGIVEKRTGAEREVYVHSTLDYLHGGMADREQNQRRNCREWNIK